jgi:hypothetical protein
VLPTSGNSLAQVGTPRFTPFLVLSFRLQCVQQQISLSINFLLVPQLLTMNVFICLKKNYPIKQDTEVTFYARITPPARNTSVS